MSVADAITGYLEETGTTQKALAERLHFHDTMIGKVVKKQRKWPEANDARLATVDPYLAWAVGYERTAGFIPPPPKEIEQNYASIKDRLVVELEEAQEVLKKVARFFRMTEEEQRRVAEETYLEIDDVVREALHWQAHIERKYKIDREKLRKQRKGEW